MRNNGRNKKTITDEELRLAYKIPTNFKIIQSVLYKYSKYIPYDILKQCGYIGLWKSLSLYDNSYGRKFTTHLYSYVNWECMHHLRDNKSKAKRLQNSIDKRTSTLFFDYFGFLSEKDKELLHNRYIKLMTLREIGRVEGITPEGVRKRIQKLVYTYIGNRNNNI